MATVVRLYIAALFFMPVAVANADLQPAHIELYKTPNTNLLQPKFQVSSKELGEQALSNENNYLNKGKIAELQRIFLNYEAKNLNFQFFDLVVKSHKIKKEMGNIWVTPELEKGTSPILKTSKEAYDYLIKEIYPRGKIVYLMVHLTNPKKPKAQE